MGRGDTLEKLAEMYHIPFEKMLAANEGMPTHSHGSFYLLQKPHVPDGRQCAPSMEFGGPDEPFSTLHEQLGIAAPTGT